MVHACVVPTQFRGIGCRPSQTGRAVICTPFDCGRAYQFFISSLSFNLGNEYQSNDSRGRPRSAKVENLVLCPAELASFALALETEI